MEQPGLLRRCFPAGFADAGAAGRSWFSVSRRLDYEFRRWNPRSKVILRVLHLKITWIDAPIDLLGSVATLAIESGAAAAASAPPRFDL